MVRRVALYACVLPALAMACGGTRRRSTLTAPGPAVLAPDAPPALPASPTEITLLPEVYRLESPIVADEAGTLLAFTGNVRLAATGQALVVSRDFPPIRICRVARLPHGWAFVALDGLVASAETFTGPLRRLGDVVPPPSLRGCTRSPLRGALSRGRVAVIAEDGGLWLSDGSQALVRAGNLPGPAGSAIFLDALHGAVTMVSGALLYTRDGAETWQAVDLSGEVAAGVVLDRGRIVVATSRGVQSLDAQGRLAPAAQPVDGFRLAADLHSERPTLWAELGALAPGLRPSLALPDGTSLAVEETDLVTYDSASGRELRRVREALPERGYRLSRWGTAVALTHPQGPFLRTLDGETLTVVNLPRGEHGALEPSVFGADGRHALGTLYARGPNPCSLGELPPSGGLGEARHEVCALLDGTRTWRRLSLESAGTNPVLGELHGSRLLVLSNQEGYLRALPRVLDTETGRWLELSLAPSPQMTEARLYGVHWLPDGQVAGLAASSNSAHWAPALALGPPERPLTLRPLPEQAMAVRMLDAARGLAVGSRLGRLWQTTDGGQRWRRLEVPVDGDPEAVRLVYPSNPRVPEVRCDEVQCTIDRWIQLRGWGEPRPTRALMLATRHPAPPAPMVRDAAGPRSTLGYRCQPQGAPSPSALRLPAPPSRGLPRPPLRFGYTGAVQTEEQRPARGAPTLSIAWSGADGAGSYQGRADRVARVEGPAFRAHPRGGARGGFLLELCADHGACRLVLVSPRGRVLEVPEAGTGERDETSWSVLGAPDGGLWVHFSQRTETYDPVDIVLRFRADGRPPERSALLVGRDASLRGLGYHRGVWGHFSFAPDASRFRGLDGGVAPSEPLPLLAGALTACPGPVRVGGSSVTVQLDRVDEVRCPARGPIEDARAELEATTEGWCLRRVEGRCGPSMAHTESASPEGYVRLAAALEDGQVGLEGHLDDASSQFSLRCAWRPDSTP